MAARDDFVAIVRRTIVSRSQMKMYQVSFQRFNTLISLMLDFKSSLNYQTFSNYYL